MPYSYTHRAGEVLSVSPRVEGNIQRGWGQITTYQVCRIRLDSGQQADEKLTGTYNVGDRVALIQFQDRDIEELNLTTGAHWTGRRPTNSTPGCIVLLISAALIGIGLLFSGPTGGLSLVLPVAGVALFLIANSADKKKDREWEASLEAYRRQVR